MSTNEGPVAKKAKIGIAGEREGNQDVHASMDKQRFKNFKVERVLSDRPRDKLMTVCGKFADREEDAVVILEKTPFTKENAEKMLSETSKTDLTLHNDIYSTFQCITSPDANGESMT